MNNSDEVSFSVNVLWPLIAHTVHTIAYKILYTVQITIVLIQPLSLIRQRGRMCTIDECAHSSLQYCVRSRSNQKPTVKTTPEELYFINQHVYPIL